MKFPNFGIKGNDFMIVDLGHFYNAILVLLSAFATILFWESLFLFLWFLQHVYKWPHHTLVAIGQNLLLILSLLGVGIPTIFLLSWKIIGKICVWIAIYYKNQQKKLKGI